MLRVTSMWLCNIIFWTCLLLLDCLQCCLLVFQGHLWNFIHIWIHIHTCILRLQFRHFKLFLTLNVGEARDTVLMVVIRTTFLIARLWCWVDIDAWCVPLEFHRNFQVCVHFFWRCNIPFWPFLFWFSLASVLKVCEMINSCLFIEFIPISKLSVCKVTLVSQEPDNFQPLSFCWECIMQSVLSPKRCHYQLTEHKRS